MSASPQGEQTASRRPEAAVSVGFWRRRWWQMVLVAVAVLGVGLLAFGYITTRNELNRLSGKTNAQGEAKALVEQIGRYMQLPDESPTLATVNDVSKLKNQEFFKNAENGDKVLIFSNSGRALLYRPSTKKVIEYSKVDLNTSAAGR